MGKTSTIKVRDSNLELFRIITMLLIVAHHYVVNSGLMEVIRGGIQQYGITAKSRWNLLSFMVDKNYILI